MFSLRTLASLLILTSAGTTFAQDAPLWLRNSAVSPDGKQLAFTYQSRIYLTTGSGGMATPLTDGSFYPHSLVWSGDNQTLAFAADIYGNDDVFTLSLDSGTLSRHTTHSAPDIPTSFSADGKSLFFSTSRLTNGQQDFYTISPYLIGEPGIQLYRIDLATDAAQNILAAPARHANWNQDSSVLLYNSPHKDQVYRKHQSSYAVPTIWQYDKNTGQHLQLTENRVAAQSPIWAPDGSGFYYLSERSGDFNVWYRDIASQQDAQLTHYNGHPVRHLSVSQAGEVFFSYQGELYRVDNHQGATAKKLAISIRHFAPQQSTQYVTSYAENMVPSQTNSNEALLVSGGDIFALDGAKQNAKNLTNSAEEEKDPSYTPDGYGVIYSALRDGQWGLYLRQSPLDEEALSRSPVTQEQPFLLLKGRDVTQPQYSPDGEQLAFVVDGRTLHSIKLADYDVNKPKLSALPPMEKSTSKKILDKLLDREVKHNTIGKSLISPEMVSYKGRFNYTWSPDSTQIAVMLTPDAYSTEVVVLDSQGEKPMIKVSQSGFTKFKPVWSSDNRILLWATTKYGLKTADGQDWDASIVGVFTNNKAMRDHKEEKEVPETLESLPFSGKNIEYRHAFKLPVASQIIDYALSGDYLTVVASVTSPAGDESTQVFEYNIRKQESTTLFADLPPTKISKIITDQSSIYLMTQDEVYWLDLDSLESESIAISLPFEYQKTPRKLAAYQQMVKQTADNFYRQDMGAVNWAYYAKTYQGFLAQINNDRDFAILMQELLGELNASHTGAYGTTSYAMQYDQTASLGLVFSSQVTGNHQPGLIVDSILPGGPFDDEQRQIAPGDEIIAINNSPVSNLKQLNAALNNKANESVEVTLAHGDNHWYERIKPIENYQAFQLMAKRWELTRRDYVSEKTKGQVGYVYLPDMSNDSYLHLRAEALGRFRNAQSLIVDVRFNGGGFLADTLIEFLTAEAAANVVPQQGKPRSDAGSRRWLKPSLVLTNSSAYSEGSAFGQYYQDLNVGPIVGEPVPGTGTAVMDINSTVYDGISYRFPFLPLKNKAGKYYENLELMPDVTVFNSPTQVEKGIDNQLDMAITQALKQINQ